jgi:DNA polymerase delta subunit 1
MHSSPAAAIYLVSGDHTRTVQIATPTIGGLMKFAVKTVTCLGCKTPLKTNKGMCAERNGTCASH